MISTDILAEKCPSIWTGNVETIWVQSVYIQKVVS